MTALAEARPAPGDWLDRALLAHLQLVNLRRAQHGDEHTAPSYRAPPVKYLAHSDEVIANRKWFSGLLWRAFPSHSEHELSEKAAPVLNLSARQVRNLLREENDAKLSTILKVLAVAGAEVVFKKMEGQ